ncbi:MAG TPA: divalent metal cation transporter [Candidatus Saccharimonadales bacterium]|nr:divalent metal cation transporter [Candidatus Saccharimonadales bacterium]
MTEKKRNPVQRFFAALGPGLITGAADDDPSGIATYSMAGAKFGTSMLWTALLTWPLMAVVQMMCARIGMVTGMGLMMSLRKKFPKPLIMLISLALFLANTINIGADLLGMADAGQMLVGVKTGVFVAVFGILITVVSVKCDYQQLARILKWLCLALFAYVITGFIIKPDWHIVLRDTVIPSVPHGHEAMQMLVAILGTTISPYLFVWQASQEVEEEKAQGMNRIGLRIGASQEAINMRALDVGVGTFFSNLVMYFIILTTGLTLHRHGVTDIETSKQAAEALRPLAGHLAATLYTLGVVGVGLLSIPTLAGSAAYAFAETFSWKQGLNEKPRAAWRFYTVFVLSMAIGMALYFFKVNPVKALYWTAIINGVLAPFLLTAILFVASDTRLMKKQPSSMAARIWVGVTALLMFGAAAGMFIF